MQIMDSIELIAENLPAGEEMPQIGPRIVSAGRAGTALVERSLVISEPGILDHHPAP